MSRDKKVFLFLIFILFLNAIIILALQHVYGLDDFTDNYINETFVDIKDDIVRNTTLDCMELEWVSVNVSAVDMDIWTTGGFTEVDVGADHLKNVNGTHIWFDDVDRDEGDRIYKDFGANFFDTYFLYHFRVYLDNARTSNPRAYFMSFSEETDSIYNTILGNKNFCGLFHRYKNVGATWELSLRMYDGVAVSSDPIVTADGLDHNKWYHVILRRLNNNVTAWFYNNALMTDLDFMLTLSVANVDNLRYFHPLNSEDQATGGRAMDVRLNKVHNFTLATGYASDGFYYTTEIASGVGGNIVALLLNTTIPNNDILTVEFSNNNITWVDHNGNAGSDTVVAGNESIDLRDLSYTQCTVRLNYTDGGLDSTPRVYQLLLITTATPSGAGATVYVYRNEHFILIIFILALAFALVYGVRRR